MSRNNRLAVLSTLLWVAIIGIIFFARFPAEDLIALSVQATIQAGSENPQSVESTKIPDDTQVKNSPEATAPITEVAVVPAEPSTPCLFAKLVAETIPDGTEVKAGTVFTKTWVIENTGACAWTSEYKLVFAGGEHMGGPDSVFIGQSVRPGERVTLSISLTAPSFFGSARSNWTLSTDTGVDFGSIWIEIDIVS